MPPARRRPVGRPRAVLYGRQSIAREESISLSLQEHANRQHCAREGYDVVKELRDEGISGRKWSNRPGAVEAVRMITAGEADVIVVWKWSRFSRNRVDLAVGFERVETSGGRVESSTEPIDTSTAVGRFGRGVLGELAVLQSEQIGDGWREVHDSRRDRGVPSTGGDRFGYRRTRDEHGRVTGYEIDDEQADTLRLAYRRVIEGYGLIRIAAELNATGRTNRVGRPFSATTLYALLDSGFAAGLLIRRARDGSGRKTGEVSYHPGVHPAIIDEGTWKAYLAARESRASVPARRKSVAHPLSGLVRCADCGAAMVSTGPSGRGPRNPPTLVCSRWRASGSDVAKCVTAVRPRVEKIVREWLAEHAADVETAAAADRTARRRRRNVAAEAKRARRSADEAEGELARLTVMRTRGELSAVGYEQAREQLEAEHEKALAAAQEAELAAVAEPVESRPLAAQLEQGWDVIPSEDLNVGLRKLIRAVWVWPAGGRGYTSPIRVVARWSPDEGIPASPGA